MSKQVIGSGLGRIMIKSGHDQVGLVFSWVMSDVFSHFGYKLGSGRVMFRLDLISILGLI